MYELEESLTIDELHRLFVAKQKMDHENRQFTAALKGVKIEPFVDPDEEHTDFDEVNKRAEIRRNLILQGKNPDDYDNIEDMKYALDMQELGDIGFGIEE